MEPSGDVAVQQRNLIILSTLLMLLIIVPVMILTVLFAWRYRASNKKAKYDPDWDHSTQLELVIWAAPLVIIICLGALTWVSTHVLDPYRPLSRIAPHRPVAASVKPLEVDVVALDWKWLFVYPEYGIATVNELAAPVDRPIAFKITASSVMNSFFVPALAGQVYAMPGMETKLHAVINKPGTFEGFSANYSGAGFSDMNFPFYGMKDADFAAWVQKVKGSDRNLDRNRYLQLELPSEDVPAQRYGTVDPALYNAILNMCVKPGKPCMSDVMRKDMGHHGGEMTPVNDTPAGQGQGEHDQDKGALQKEPLEKGSSPHQGKPRNPHPPGAREPGSKENRNFSLNDRPAAVTPTAPLSARS